MKKRIVCLVLSLAIVFGVVAFNGTQAWFATGSAKHHYLNSGKLSYVLNGNLVQIDENTTVFPGLELVDEALSLENHSNIDSQVRISIEYTYFNDEGEPVTAKYAGSDDDILAVELADEWVLSNGYYYYGGVDNVIAPASDTDEEIEMITSLKYDGPKTTIANSGKTVGVSVNIESKQADYVTWTQLDTVTTTP